MRLRTDSLDERAWMQLARIKHTSDFEGLMKVLQDSNDQINRLLRGDSDIEHYRNQGAGQVIDELIEIFDNALEISKKMNLNTRRNL